MDSLRLKVQGPSATVGMSVPAVTPICKFRKLLAESLGLEERQCFTVLVGFPPLPLAVEGDEETVPVSTILRSGKQCYTTSNLIGSSLDSRLRHSS
jgi:hypothetical protein